MPRHRSAMADDPHFDRALPCQAECGGEIVLLDRGKAAGDGRYVVRHHPSGREVSTGKRSAARKLYKALAAGVDERGILPAPAPPGNGHEVLRPPPLSPDHPSRARVREAEEARTMEGNSLALAARLEQEFPEDDIVGYFRSLLEAERSFLQDGNLVSTPDFAVREKALRLLVEYRYGKAFNRAEPKGAKAVNLDAFREKVRRSPEFRAALRRICEAAEHDVPAPAPADKGSGAT